MSRKCHPPFWRLDPTKKCRVGSSNKKKRNHKANKRSMKYKINNSNKGQIEHGDAGSPK